MTKPRLRLSILASCLWVAGLARAQTVAGAESLQPDLPPLPASKSEDEPKPAPKKQAQAAKTKAAKAAPTGDPALDPKAARADDSEPVSRRSPRRATRAPLSAGSKALRDTLEERLKWLDAYDLAIKERNQAENPNPSPEHEAAERKAELEHAKAVLNGSAGGPDKLLPELFQGNDRNIPEAKLNEMRDAIDEPPRAEVKDRSAELEKLRAGTGRDRDPGDHPAPRRAGQDRPAGRHAPDPPGRARDRRC